MTVRALRTSVYAAVSWAFSRWPVNTGMASAAKMAMMMITTKISMRVKPHWPESRRLVRNLLMERSLV